jgi:hypothetical protein
LRQATTSLVACCSPPPQRHPPLPVAHQPCGHLCCQTQPQTRSNLTNETAAIMEAVVAHQQHGLLRGGVTQVNTRTREAAGHTTLSPAAHSTTRKGRRHDCVVCNSPRMRVEAAAQGFRVWWFGKQSSSQPGEKPGTGIAGLLQPMLDTAATQCQADKQYACYRGQQPGGPVCWPGPPLSDLIVRGHNAGHQASLPPPFAVCLVGHQMLPAAPYMVGLTLVDI